MASQVFYVYILGSLSRRLYTGVTRDLMKRVYQHRTGDVEGHTRAYRISRLLYYETTSNVHAAIAREKQIKAWRREKRVRLIEQNNPAWPDLALHWFAAGEPQAQGE
jgi:putative endonuclease